MVSVYLLVCYSLLVNLSVQVFEYALQSCNTVYWRFLFKLGIEFYLFVSHGGMNDTGSTCKFRNGSSVFHTSMRNKQVEFNPYTYILSKLSRFGYEISVNGF